MKSDLLLDKAHDLFRLRGTLESFAFARVRHAPGWDGLLCGLKAKLEGMEKAAKRGDYNVFHGLDMEFHGMMVEAAGMPALLSSWSTVVGELDECNLHIKRTFWTSLMALYREHVFLIEALESPSPRVGEQALQYHLEAGWFRVASMEGNPLEAAGPADRAASFMSTHFASRMDVEWIAKHVCFVSASHLNRLFRRQFGMSPHAWMKQVRLDRAAELMINGEGEVHEVAGQVGYRNVSHFVRDFRCRFKMPPLQYRKSQRSG